MTYIIQKIENNLLTYQPGEFMPIWVEGKLKNKRQFAIYKARQILAR